MSLEDLKEFGQAWSPLVVLITSVLGVVWALFGVRTGFWSRCWEKLKALWSTDVCSLRAENAALNKRLDQVRSAFDDNNNLWLRGPVEKPPGYDACLRASIPILLFANLKGGVGKTTLAAYLAAYFEREKGERILAIDLDHQGSLSSMLLPDTSARERRPAETIKTLVGGRTNGSPFAHQTQIRHSTNDSRLIECDDAFGNFENRLLLEWLIGDYNGDIRFNLTRFLHSPYIQDNFDRVIIDAPPRMTTGLISALCASTHLIVPFVLDLLSAERVGLFLHTIRNMRGSLFPHLELAGVVGTMKGDGSQKLRDAEEEALREAERGARAWGNGSYVLRDVLIPRRQQVADLAGVGVDDSVGSVFAPLGRRLFDLTPSGLAPVAILGPGVHRPASVQGNSRYESQLAGRAPQ